MVGYTRVSTDEQASSGLGLKAQRTLIEAECERRGWELVQVFEDAGASGKALSGRPALAKALEAVQRRRLRVPWWSPSSTASLDPSSTSPP